jgi:signal transduction histidine kinase
MRLRDSASSTKPVVIPKRKPPSAAYWLLALVLPVAFFWLAGRFDARDAIPAKWQRSSAIWQSQPALVPGELPPSAGASVQLPHRPNTQDKANGYSWYRFDLPLEALPQDMWALYARNPRAGFEVFVNGALVAGPESISSPHRYVVRPAILAIPPALLRTGDNRIDVRVVTRETTSAFAPVAIGPAADLRPVFGMHSAFDVTVKQATVAAMLLFAFLFAIIYALRRRDTVFATYGSTIVVWALQVWHSTLAIPVSISPQAWRALGYALLASFVVCGAMTVHRFLGHRPRRFERFCWVLVGLFSISMWLLGDRLEPAGADSLYRYLGGPALLALGGRSIWQLARAAIANATIERRIMLLCCGLVWIVGLRDFAHEARWLGDGAYESYLPYTVSFVLLAFGSLILLRFARALRETEYLNRELEARVAQKAAELEANYARIRVFERDQALVAERARIMRDMHDGIGGQLVAAIALASKPGAQRELDSLLHEALDDLRTMIDSLESSEADLLTALGMLRMRVTSRFAAAGLEFRWEVSDIPKIRGFGPEQVLQVMRIVQEAFTNTLKHANAHTITVRTSTQALPNGEAGVAVEIEDDGAGLQSPERVGGRGLANMRRRAQSLGADLEIGPIPNGGTRVVVRLPVSGVAMA